MFKKQVRAGRFSNMGITDTVSESFEMECKEMGELSDDIYKSEIKRDIFDVAQEFRVISDDTITVIANWDLSAKICAGGIISAKELQRGSVNLKKPLVKQLKIQDCELPSLAKEQYDPFLGYMKTLL